MGLLLPKNRPLRAHLDQWLVFAPSPVRDKRRHESGECRRSQVPPALASAAWLLDNVVLAKATVTPDCTQNSDCSDQNTCTTDACVNGTCQNTNNTLACADDGNPCTNDVCSGGACTHPNNTASCADDGNPCTNDVCSGGACTHPNNTASCADDGDSCTNDVCSNGPCTHPSNGSCGGGGDCSKPRWSSTSTYQSGDIVVEDCEVSIPGTACY
jgi:hypothetical protein